jgi:hypothetical protein
MFSFLHYFTKWGIPDVRFLLNQDFSFYFITKYLRKENFPPFEVSLAVVMIVVEDL